MTWSFFSNSKIRGLSIEGRNNPLFFNEIERGGAVGGKAGEREKENSLVYKDQEYPLPFGWKFLPENFRPSKA